MSIDKSANIKLSAFFDKQDGKKINKEAALGGFNNVLNEADIKSVEPMIYEMLQLPKYETIKRKLSSSTGLINFVTNDEYAPLVELLIRSVFPPENNDVYDMGMDTSEGDYFVDSRRLFQDSPQNMADANKAAQTQLRDLLFGKPSFISTKDKMGEEYMMTDDQYSSAFGDITPPAQRGAQGAPPPSVAEMVSEYKDKVREVNERWNRLINEVKKEIRDAKGEGEALSDPSLLRKLQNKKKVFVSMKKRETDGLNAQYQESLSWEDPFSQEVIREENGFSHFNPTKDIRELSNNVIIVLNKDGATPAETRNSLNALSEALENYQTGDKKLDALRSKILELVKVASPDDIRKLRDKRHTLIQYQKAFNDRLSNHGQLMILDNFDESVLCTPPQGKDESNSALFDNDVLAQFNRTNNNNISRGDSGKKIVLISKRPIDKLGAQNVVEMNMSRVDDDEAVIITKHLLERSKDKALKILQIKKLSELDKRFPEPLSAEDRVNKNLAKREIRNEIMKEKGPGGYGSLGYDIQKQMETLIVGLGQGEAIRSVKNAIQYSTEDEFDESGEIQNGVSYDGEKLIDNLVDSVNKSATREAYGITFHKPSIPIEGYAYKDATDWANAVESVKMQADDLFFQDETIKNATNRLREANAEISSNATSAETKQESVQVKDDMQKIIQDSITQRKDIAAQMPHTYLLYGKSGTGKTAWAEALADLMKTSYGKVNLGSQFHGIVGSTEERVRELKQALLDAKQSVFLLDEFDRQLSQSGGEQGSSASFGGQAPHEVSKRMMGELLDFFEEPANKKRFEDNDVFIILTTNYIDDIDKAMKSRFPNKFEVFRPEDPRAYERLLDHLITTEKERRPDLPFFRGKKADGTMETDEEAWETTEKMLIEGIDLPSICQSLAEKSVDFRLVTQLIKEAFSSHAAYLRSLSKISRGDAKLPAGLPLTRRNILNTIPLMNKDLMDIGLFKYRSRVHSKMEEIFGDAEFKKEEFTDVFGNKKERYILPDEVTKLMGGESEDLIPYEEESVDEKIKYKQQEDDTGRTRMEVEELTPEQEMEQLTDDGFEEGPLEQKKAPSMQEPEGKTEKETTEELDLLSSTDYLYDYLKKEGFVSEDGTLVEKTNKSVKVNEEKTAQVMQSGVDDLKQVVDKGFQKGIYLFGGPGGLVVAPMASDVPVQSFANDPTVEKSNK